MQTTQRSAGNPQKRPMFLVNMLSESGTGSVHTACFARTGNTSKPSKRASTAALAALFAKFPCICRKLALLVCKLP